MKYLILIPAFLILTSCGETTSQKKQIPNFEQKQTPVTDTLKTENNTTTTYKLPEEVELVNNDSVKQILHGFEKASLYRLSDTITADFNGDGYSDKAFIKMEGKKSGIIILHGNLNEEYKIGFGKKFAFWPDFNCEWVNYWGLIEDKKTHGTIFSEDGESIENEDMELQNPSIVLGQYEVGGGLITYKGGQYIWIHQTC